MLGRSGFVRVEREATRDISGKLQCCFDAAECVNDEMTCSWMNFLRHDVDLVPEVAYVRTLQIAASLQQISQAHFFAIVLWKESAHVERNSVVTSLALDSLTWSAL